MINLTLGYTDASGAAGFPDVTSDKWFYQYDKLLFSCYECL